MSKSMCEVYGLLAVLLLSVAMSLDAVWLGVSFGVRKIKLGLSPALIISLTGLFVISLASAAGAELWQLLPPSIGKVLGSLILMGMGVWIITEGFKKPEDTENRTLKIVRSPEEGDLDKSGSIDKTEAFFLGLALSLDSLGICVGAGSMRLSPFLPFAAAAAQLIFIAVGIRLGKIVGERVNAKICTLLSGGAVVLIGIFNML